MFKNYNSLDGLIHTERIKQFDLALRAWQIPPRLAPTLIDSIGYPLFVVNYQLPYYFAEIVMLTTQNAAIAYKITMAVTFILGAIFAFLMFKETMSTQSAFAGSITFTYLPYRFGDLYQRGAFGESVSIMFVPLIIIAFHKIKNSKKYGIPLLAIATFGLVTSHTIVLMIFAPLLILYVPFILKPNLKQLKTIAVGTLLGIGLSSFQILPSLYEKNYMKFTERLLYLYKDFYLNIYQLLRIPRPNVNYGTYYQVGIAATVITITTIITLIKKLDLRLFFFLVFTILSIFLTTSYSNLLWQYLPLIKYILYPYRFLNLTIFSVAFLAAILVEKTRFKTLLATFIILLILYTNRHFFTIAPWFSITPSSNLTTQNENDTIWSNANTFIDRPTLTSTPQSNIYITSQKPFNVDANIINTEESKITIRKMYFPGWILKVNGQKTPVIIEDGLITTSLKPGSWQIETYFTESPLRAIADLLTIASSVIVVILFFKPKLLSKI